MKRRHNETGDLSDDGEVIVKKQELNESTDDQKISSIPLNNSQQIHPTVTAASDVHNEEEQQQVANENNNNNSLEISEENKVQNIAHDANGTAKPVTLTAPQQAANATAQSESQSVASSESLAKQQNNSNNNNNTISSSNLNGSQTTNNGVSQASKMNSSQIEQLKLQYLNQRDLKKLVELCQPYPDIYKEFQKLKYKNKIYSIQDLVLIQNADDLRNDFIGQLTRIIRIENQGKYITLIQIKWYYKKDDLPKKFENIIDCISENEIFETDHLDITFVDCINGPCRLYSYHEFDKLSSISNNTFYTRAKFDTVKKKLNPPFEKWEQGCICGKPLNPDYLYIQCEKCDKWFHIKCVGIQEDEVETIEFYKCPPCVKSNQPSNTKMTLKDIQVIKNDEDKEPPVVATNKRAAPDSRRGRSSGVPGNHNA